ncbi:MAG: Kef family K(+) transporter [Gemmatimonadota bacterium]|nr:Kef family K(+) transporter [Gemmatimonadota bacterium]
MPHDTALVATIAIGLALAFLFGFAAARLRLPPLVGYLVAGVVVGPFTPGFVADAGLAGQLAELGVILLMFGVGLHFSVRDLLAVRRIAVPGAIAQIAAATALGAGVAHLWGWSFGAGLVFGLALSVASTVVLLRALDEQGLLESVNGRIAIGWLIVEDLAMVVALVLLPALAPSLGGAMAGTDGGGQSILATLGVTLGKVILFLALMLFVGARVVPWMLEQVARVGSRELFTLSVLAVALGIAFGAAALFGVSFALGAFFAGVVVNGSDLSHAAAAEALPLQDAFAVLFFVSVGMLFDPSVIVREPVHVLAVLAIILLGKSAAAFAIVLLFRHPVGTALTVSASLAQIGEFSFILAGLGVSLGLLPTEGQSLVLAGALLSITLNPLMFRATRTIEHWFHARPGLLAALERPSPVPVALPDGSDEPPLRDHAIIVGFGRVGSTIGKALDRHALPYVVVEQDREVVERLRARKVLAVYGDAARLGILEHAHTDRARVLIVTAPEPFHARQVITLARRLNPEIDTVVRTHTSADQAYLERLGVGLAVMGERELAFGMTRYALRGFGVAADEAETSLQAMRLIPATAHTTPPRPEPVG